MIKCFYGDDNRFPGFLLATAVFDWLAVMMIILMPATSTSSPTVVCSRGWRSRSAAAHDHPGWPLLVVNARATRSSSYVACCLAANTRYH